jgi:hypothetical protein
MVGLVKKWHVFSICWVQSDFSDSMALPKGMAVAK